MLTVANSCGPERYDGGSLVLVRPEESGRQPKESDRQIPARFHGTGIIGRSASTKSVLLESCNPKERHNCVSTDTQDYTNAHGGLFSIFSDSRTTVVNKTDSEIEIREDCAFLSEHDVH